MAPSLKARVGHPHLNVPAPPAQLQDDLAWLQGLEGGHIALSWLLSNLVGRHLVWVNSAVVIILQCFMASGGWAWTLKGDKYWSLTGTTYFTSYFWNKDNAPCTEDICSCPQWSQLERKYFDQVLLSTQGSENCQTLEEWKPAAKMEVDSPLQ